MKVLVVEDEPLHMELVLAILNSLGFISHGAATGEEAIEKIEKELYDLIIMDIALPRMNGVEVMKKIKSRSAYKDVPVIALTAYAMKWDRERFLAEGFDDYIPKPMDVPDFIKRMEKYRK